MPNEIISDVKAGKCKGVMKMIHLIDAGVVRVEKFCMFLASLLLFVNMTWGVAARYLFSIPAPYTEELSIMLYVWLTFWGVSYLIGVDGHPAIEIFSSRVKTSANVAFRKCYFTLIYGVMLLFAGLAGIKGLSMMPMYIAQKTISLGISYGFIYGVGVVVLLVMCARCLFKIITVWIGEEQ